MTLPLSRKVIFSTSHFQDKVYENTSSLTGFRWPDCQDIECSFISVGRMSEAICAEASGSGLSTLWSVERMTNGHLRDLLSGDCEAQG